MFFYLLVLFTVVPVLELYILIKVGDSLGILNTIAVVVITGIAGAAFAKSQGIYLLSKIRNMLIQGQLPGKELLQGAMVLCGGVMLITPGFMTDIIGFSLLVPYTRKAYGHLILSYFEKKYSSQDGHSNSDHVNQNNTDQVIVDHPKIDR